MLKPSEAVRTMGEPAQLAVVLVLYRMRINESPAYRGLVRAMRESDVARRVRILVCDNSPNRQELPEDFRGEYHHDGINPGLAMRYNQGLNFAKKMHTDWLMVLDQDTNLTTEYLVEALESSSGLLGTERASDSEVGAIVPKLVERGILLSPNLPLFFRFGKPNPIDPNLHGVQSHGLSIYNSGAIFRVDAIEAIGGFPEAFWLDYLDHATFRLLTAGGWKVFVMRSVLQHELSTNQVGPASKPISVERERNMLRAEQMYYRKYGSGSERLRFVLRRIRMVLVACKSLSLDRVRMLLKLSFF